jgi:OmpA-OmpF porin, OOP family
VLAKVATIAATIATILAGHASRAHAQAAVPLDTTIDAQLFQPAIGPRNFITLDAPTVPEHKLFGFGLVLHYQHRPYSVFTQGANPTQSHLIDHQLTTDLTAAMGLFGRYQVGFALPFTPYLAGDEITETGMPRFSRLTESGIGDVRVEGKAVIATLGEDENFTLGVSGGLSLPTGKSASRPYLGDKTVTGRVRALALWDLDRVQIAANVGLLIRDTSRTFATQLGPQLLYGAAVLYPVDRRLDIMLEMFGRSGLNQFIDFYSDVNPFEVDIAARYAVAGMWSIMAGGGRGFGNGIGTPDIRLFAGASFNPDYRDRDKDGIYDVNDKCPDQTEDRDNFQDQDGCPDPDNDGDTLPDVQDKCPNDPEDVDQFEDEDGCAEADNDKDGIPDINDPCPNAAEDGQGKKPQDGCPSTTEDTDGDGVPDSVDKCADEPEDRDNFQDDDGCPDPDNDADGIPDDFDNCPNAAEDPDGFEDEDGCPDPDNDKDGLPDALDRCPTQAETLNGNKDDDGCPDPGAEIARLTEGRIDLDQKIGFVSKGGKLQVKEGSAKVINLVALILKGHAEIQRLRIEVRAEGLGRDETQRRADVVRDLLVERGVETARLTPVGAGAGPSRVEFIVDNTPAPKPAAAPAPSPGSGTTPSAPAPAKPNPPPVPPPPGATPPPPGAK